ncbi:MAG TPA: hypothetical protein VFT65_16415 [Candidatus Angelobacter sp.]|nr:hypothetical protein [Candidatus Angelobacter sp.]
MDRQTFNKFAKRICLAVQGKVIFVAALAAFLLMAPLGAGGQFGLDPCCAIISAGLNTISSLLTNVVARPLSQIQQIQQEMANFQQQVIYPTTAINNARGLASQLQGQLRQINQLYRLPINSATLPTPQQLEQALLSRNPQALGQVSQGYAAVYGSVMAPADAPQPIRDLVDMSDAEAEAALKKAVELDALADVEQAAADQISQQIQGAAPGSAPILEAQASAWLVRANAYTQSAMAELIRVRSIDLANTGAQLKVNATDVNTLRNNTSQALQRGTQ